MSAVELLIELGCEVSVANFSAEGWLESSRTQSVSASQFTDSFQREHLSQEKHPQSPRGAIDIVFVDPGGDMGAARFARKALLADPVLGTTPVLLAVEVPRLGGLDFSMGYTDFVLAPFVPAEVHARLRQMDWKTSLVRVDNTLRIGDLVIDRAGREVRVANRVVGFTPQEFDLLVFLTDNLGRAVERDEILCEVWGYRTAVATRTVDIHIRRLRAKLGAPFAESIETIRGVGYKWRQ